MKGRAAKRRAADAIVSLDRIDPTEHLRLRHFRIAVPVRVTACRQEKAIPGVSHADETMRKQAIVVSDEHDLARDDLRWAATPNPKHVARANRRQHARTRDAQPSDAVVANDVPEQRRGYGCHGGVHIRTSS